MVTALVPLSWIAGCGLPVTGLDGRGELTEIGSPTVPPVRCWSALGSDVLLLPWLRFPVRSLIEAPLIV